MLNKLRTIEVTRYSTPLREGGSLPAIIEADDDGLYVLKLRGAAQGIKALIAELISGEIARVLGLPVPEIVLANLDSRLSRTEPDPEIQDQLRASGGINIALDYLPGSITFDPLVDHVDPKLASQIVWFDGLVQNIDRTYKNPNLLIWHKKLWLIDHGASLYFQHRWENWEADVKKPFIQVADHILLRKAADIEGVNGEFTKRLTKEKIAQVVSLIPEEWIEKEFNGQPADQVREVYVEFIFQRGEGSRVFVDEVLSARKKLI